MTVYCQQLVDGEALDPEQVISPPVEGMTDAQIMEVKAASASEKDWDVEWLSETEFVARKVRWSPDTLCERIFRIG